MLLQVGTVENEFRVFQMEVLAGEARFETEVTQHSAPFRRNFAEVRTVCQIDARHTTQLLVPVLHAELQ